MAGRIRTPKNFVVEERLARYEPALEVAPERYAGRWASACAPIGGEPFRRVHLDLGCGKGAYALERARREPETLFIAMDSEPVCIAYAGQAACENGLGNLVVVPGSARGLPRMFAPNELSSISLNFPTPHPKARHARERLVHLDRLLDCRGLLAPGGELTFRTDSEPLWLYALAQFEAAGYRTLWLSRDARAEHPELPSTEYESRLAELGARTYGICATPGEKPSAPMLDQGRAVEQSLAAYLPKDVSSLAYVPYGMEETVANLRNRALRERRQDGGQ